MFDGSHRLYIDLRNEGLSAPAKNITAEISTTDTVVTGIPYNSLNFGDINAGEIKSCQGFYKILTTNPPPIDTINFAIKIYSDGYEFWHDTTDIVIGLYEKETNTPKTYSLRQNYPKPVDR